MFDILFLIFVIYYIFSLMVFLVGNSYFFIVNIYSWCFYLADKLSMFFTFIADYFSRKIEEIRDEEITIFGDSDNGSDSDNDSDNGSDSDVVCSVDEIIPHIEEVTKSKYPSDFTSIHIT